MSKKQEQEKPVKQAEYDKFIDKELIDEILPESTFGKGFFKLFFNK